jgi:hypothetical protein
VLEKFASVTEGRGARVFVEDLRREQLLLLAEDALDDLHAILRRGSSTPTTGDVGVLAPTL